MSAPKFNDLRKSFVIGNNGYLQSSKTKDSYGNKREMCYRLLFVHALWYYAKETDASKESIIDKIAQLFKYISETPSDLKGKQFDKLIDIFPFKNESGRVGFTVVDRSGACFPLIIYPKEVDKGNRKGALYKSIEEIYEKREEISNIIFKSKTLTLWDGLKQKIENVLTEIKGKPQKAG